LATTACLSSPWSIHAVAGATQAGCVATCGAFTPEGDFLEVPEFDTDQLLRAWQEAVFALYLAHEKAEGDRRESAHAIAGQKIFTDACNSPRTRPHYAPVQPWLRLPSKLLRAHGKAFLCHFDCSPEKRFPLVRIELSLPEVCTVDCMERIAVSCFGQNDRSSFWRSLQDPSSDTADPFRRS
jgi:hypothetical protein